MCGLCGIYGFEAGAAATGPFEQSVRRMTRGLERRGPDDEQFWLDPEGRLHLGFRRLAILDLSPVGRQPMVSASGDSVLVLNGEIYNFGELARELEGEGFVRRSSGDAEVALEALERWDLAALERFEGMFALAFYDRRHRRLTLARDRTGIKPLHILEHPEGLAFSSQLDSLLDTPWTVDPVPKGEVLHLYLRLGHIPPPYGLLTGIRQLEPGQFLRVNADGRREDGFFWKLPMTTYADFDAQKLPEAVDTFDAAFERAVERHRLSDVPLGVFLSGGVDSPLVTSVARGQTSSELRAFTLGNPGWAQDEESAARHFAEQLDVDHHVLQLGDDDAIEAIDQVKGAMHEPFADFSLLPTLLISAFARRHVTVALSGDGGDELFFGYERPRSLLRDGRFFRWPLPVRQASWALGRAVPGLTRRSDVILFKTMGDYYYEVNCRLGKSDLSRLAPDLPPAPELPIYRSEPWHRWPGDPRQQAHFSRWAEFHGQLQRCLKKVDLASMHHSLEVRVPLLDTEILDLSLRIDPLAHLGLRSGGRAGEPAQSAAERKVVLRRALERRLPGAAQQSAKRGFSIPLADLLRGALKDEVEATLFDAPLYPHGLFRRDAVEAFWRRHLRGESDEKWGLWSLLCLQWWAGNVGFR